MKTIAAAVCIFGCIAGAAFAQGSGAGKGPTMTTEQRQTMAAAHEKMAACLRSDKALDDCHGEMMKVCHEAKGENACPMMGGMMHGKGHGSMHHEKHEEKQEEKK